MHLKKMKTIIADTNVWYNLSGNRNKQKLLNCITSKGNLFATPISFLELVSKMNMSSEFSRRKNAVHAVIKYARGCLPTHEFVLAGYFGILIKDGINWMDRFRTVNSIKNSDEFKNKKVIYTKERGLNSLELVSVDINQISDWRKNLYRNFSKSVVNAITLNIEPQYGQQVKTGNIIPIRDKDKLLMLDEKKMYESIMSVLLYRVKFVVKNQQGEDVDFNKKKIINKARGKVDCYAKMYIEYIKDILKRGSKPDKNDLGDFENFMYLQNDDYILATIDKKMINICRKVYPNRILDLNPYIKKPV